jgi:8-oxo-dGTP diphosphatase
MANPNYIVAAIAFITDRSDRVLMIQNPAGSWGCPGGTIEKGEDIIAGLEREVFEETGTRVAIGQLAGVYSNLTLDMVVFSFLSTYLSGTLTTSPESVRVEWVNRDDCLNRVSSPVVLARMRDMLYFNGQVIYRSYTSNPYQEFGEYRV